MLFFKFYKNLSPIRNPVYLLSYVNVLLLGLGLYLLSSSYIFAPGLTINLPALDKEHIESASIRNNVLTIVNGQMLLFEGNIYSLRTLAGAFQKEKKDTALLVKCDIGVNMEVFFSVCQMAKKAGYTVVHIAARVKDEKIDPFDF